jgi:hypothetical protein
LIGGRGSAAFHEGRVLQQLVGQTCKWVSMGASWGAPLRLFLNATLSHGVRESRPVRDCSPSPCWRGEGLAAKLLDKWSETLQSDFCRLAVSDA